MTKCGWLFDGLRHAFSDTFMSALDIRLDGKGNSYPNDSRVDGIWIIDHPLPQVVSRNEKGRLRSVALSTV